MKNKENIKIHVDFVNTRGLNLIYSEHSNLEVEKQNIELGISEAQRII